MNAVGFSLDPAFLSHADERTLFRTFSDIPAMAMAARLGVPRRLLTCFEIPGANDPTERSSLGRALIDLRERVAAATRVEPTTFTQADVWQYPVGSERDWHIETPAYGSLICTVSLGGAARLRLALGGRVRSYRATRGSLYCLRGPARTTWQHKIDSVRGERTTITFRKPPTRHDGSGIAVQQPDRQRLRSRGRHDRD